MWKSNHHIMQVAGVDRKGTRLAVGADNKGTRSAVGVDNKGTISAVGVNMMINRLHPMQVAWVGKQGNHYAAVLAVTLEKNSHSAQVDGDNKLGNISAAVLDNVTKNNNQKMQVAGGNKTRILQAVGDAEREVGRLVKLDLDLDGETRQ